MSNTCEWFNHGGEFYDPCNCTCADIEAAAEEARQAELREEALAVAAARLAEGDLVMTLVYLREVDHTTIEQDGTTKGSIHIADDRPCAVLAAGETRDQGNVGYCGCMACTTIKVYYDSLD